MRERIHSMRVRLKQGLQENGKRYDHLTRTSGFFAFMGFLNLYVAFNYSTEAWVNFKLFGSMGLMFGFVVAQSLLLSKYIHEEETK